VKFEVRGAVARPDARADGGAPRAR
jgi:hypothetical protein